MIFSINILQKFFESRGWINSEIGFYNGIRILIFKDYFYGKAQKHPNRKFLDSWRDCTNKKYENYFFNTIKELMEQYNLKQENFRFVENPTNRY